jgi:ArsR family transcriptional regulator, arsenate/arsenite/antimonite-responsive transcriptional repressor
MAVDVAPDQREVLKALAEPARWRILERLGHEELCVCHLVEELGLPQPLVSHHLKVLRSAGLVESERFKQWSYYRLRPDALTVLGGRLTELAATVPPPSERRRPCC